MYCIESEVFFILPVLHCVSGVKKNENWNNDDTSNYITFFHIKLWAMEDQPNLNTSCMARWSDFSPLDLARKQSKGDLVWDVCKAVR